jgi:diaminopimelate decarboxylase
VEPETHAALAVGAGDSKFGLSAGAARALIEGPLLSRAGIAVRGVHVHVGSQLAGLTAWAQGARAALRMITWMRREAGIEADLVDFGGGFPAGVIGAPGPREFRAVLDDVLRGEDYERPARLAIEPGRCVVASAVTILSRVLHVRWRGDRQHVVIDAGMTELIRPALYSASHPIRVVLALPDDRDWIETRVDGPVCESADTLGIHRLPPLRRGDLVSIAYAGAYAASLSSHYNGRPRPAEVFMEQGGELTLVSDRWDVD